MVCEPLFIRLTLVFISHFFARILGISHMLSSKFHSQHKISFTFLPAISSSLNIVVGADPSPE